MTADLQRFKELIAKAATGKPLGEAEATDAFGLMMCDYGEPKLTTGSNKPAPKRSATSVI